MSQRNVERVLGRLVTDEGFRRRFEESPVAALRDVVESGVELSLLELRALRSVDLVLATRFADSLDPRIQKVCLTRIVH